MESTLTKAEDEIRRAGVPRKKKTKSPWYSVLWPGLTQFLEGKKGPALTFMFIYAALLLALVGLISSGTSSFLIITAIVAGMVGDMVFSIADSFHHT
jgi:hypothetical protein